jgi:anti-sigma factor RsiW
MRNRCAELEPLHSAWVDGELNGVERARLAAHLQRCARCRSAITELRVTQSMLRSLPVRRLPADVRLPARPAGDLPPRRGALRRAAARSTVGVVAVTITLGVAAFAAGGQDVPPPGAPVPVDVYVADHLVRAVGGPVSTPALLQARP